MKNNNNQHDKPRRFSWWRKKIPSDAAGSLANSSWWKVAYRFRAYIRPERWLIAGSLLALLTATFVRLLKPLPLAFAVDHILVSVVEHVDKIDDGVANETAVNNIQVENVMFGMMLESIDTQYLLLGCDLAVILIALLMAAGSYFSTIGLSLAGSRILAKVRSDLFAHLLGLSMRFHSKAKNGDLTMRLVSDVGMLREAVVTAPMPMLANIFVLSGMLAVMLYLDWKLTLFAIALLPLLWLTTKRSGKRIHQVSREQRKKEGNLASKASEYFASIRTIQSLSLEDEEIIAAAKMANAHDFIMAMPEGYDTVLSERGGSLSGGQRQRIAIARAAINRSTILVFDEPTVGLDRESESHVINALHRLMKLRTTILITHDFDYPRLGVCGHHRPHYFH